MMKDTSTAGSSRISPMSLPEIPPFKPHPLLQGGNRQTIAGVYLPSGRLLYRAQQHLIELDDGDKIALHEDCPTDWQVGDRAALLIHGLGGCHASPYMARIADKLTARGVRVFRMDLRGWGAGANIAAQPFHAARTEDIGATVDAIRRLASDSPLFAVGFSLGANMLLKWLGDLGRAGRNADVTKALAIAPPIDLMRCCLDLGRGFGRVYDRKYAGFLWQHLRDRKDVVPEFANALSTRPPKRIYEFDERFTAPLGGFESVEHYYETASGRDVLPDIKVSTLILTANDDPIVPGRVFDDARLSPEVSIHRTERGGHLGYIAARNGEGDRRWMDWRVVDFVTQPTS